MAHDILSSARVRKRRWRARKRLEKLEAEKAARAAHRAALDAARVSRGLLPIVEARREKVRKFREKQKLLGEIVKTSWFAPSLTDIEFEEYANDQGLDASQRESRWASLNRVAAMCEVNVNSYLIQHYGQGAEDARLRFHECWLQVQDIQKAIEGAKTIKIQFVGRNTIYVDLNRQERYQAAREKWGDGSEIVAALLGKSAV